MVNDGLVQAFGVMGGCILSAMMAPQIWQLYRTRSAEDLSHTFLALYNFGLLALSIYNIFNKLWVFLVACMVQMSLGVLLQLGKVWADRYQRQQREKAGSLAHSLSLRSGAKLDFSEFAAGGTAPFPLLHPAPSHAAQHLLVDARLALSAGAGANGGGSAAGGVAAGGDGSSGSGVEDLAATPPSGAACVFADVTELLREALSTQGLLTQQQPALVALPKAAPAPLQRRPTLRSRSSKGRQAGQREADGGKQAGEPAGSAFFQCKDGYVAAVWHGDSASLSVDCLAVTAHSMRSMAAAAEAFCGALTARFPGSRVAASSLGRLPTAADEEEAEQN